MSKLTDPPMVTVLYQFLIHTKSACSTAVLAQMCGYFMSIIRAPRFVQVILRQDLSRFHIWEKQYYSPVLARHVRQNLFLLKHPLKLNAIRTWCCVFSIIWSNASKWYPSSCYPDVCTGWPFKVLWILLPTYALELETFCMVIFFYISLLKKWRCDVFSLTSINPCGRPKSPPAPQKKLSNHDPFHEKY